MVPYPYELRPNRPLVADEDAVARILHLKLRRETRAADCWTAIEPSSAAASFAFVAPPWEARAATRRSPKPVLIILRRCEGPPPPDKGGNLEEPATVVLAALGIGGG